MRRISLPIFGHQYLRAAFAIIRRSVLLTQVGQLQDVTACVDNSAFDLGSPLRFWTGLPVASFMNLSQVEDTLKYSAY
jgi:hypothetical protein